jgi:hypothetical protein
VWRGETCQWSPWVKHNSDQIAENRKQECDGLEIVPIGLCLGCWVEWVKAVAEPPHSESARPVKPFGVQNAHLGRRLLQRRWQELEASAVPVVYGLGDDADVGNAGLAESVDDCAEGTEGNGFIGAEVDDIFLRLGLFFDFVGKLVDVDGVVAEIDELVLVHGYDEALLSHLFYGVGFWDVDFDAGLKDGSGDHEDDQEN